MAEAHGLPHGRAGMQGDDGVLVFAGEQRPPRHHLIQHRPLPAEVGARRYLADCRQLRRFAAGRANGRALSPRGVYKWGSKMGVKEGEEAGVGSNHT